MKSSSRLLYRSVAPALLMFFAITLFSSCLKNNNDNLAQQPQSGLMAFNLAANKSAVGFAVAGTAITSAPVGFLNYTGAYLSILPGTATVQAFDYNFNNPVASVVGNFEATKYYSVFLVGDSAKNENIIVNDNLDSLASIQGTAYVRYINAIPDSLTIPTVKISSNNQDVFNGQGAYKTVSDFKAAAAGDITVNVSNEADVQVSRILTLEAGKAYTILIAGRPGANDDVYKPQIKFIVNGTIK